MNAVEIIRKVISKDSLDSKLISRSLMYLPTTGASEVDIAQAEKNLPRALSEPHRRVLAVWNGLDLDVVRLHGVGPVEPGIRSLQQVQDLLSAEFLEAGAVAFASDPSGFLYVENADGSVGSLNSDGGEVVTLVASMDEFFTTFVFGPRAAEFAGSEWVAALRRAGLV